MTLAETPHLSASERCCLERYAAMLVADLGDELDELWLFGSAARGDMWPASLPMRSDIDVLVVTRTEIPAERLDELVTATYPLFLECGRQIGPQFRTRDGRLPADSVLLWSRG